LGPESLDPHKTPSHPTSLNNGKSEINWTMWGSVCSKRGGVAAFRKCSQKTCWTCMRSQATSSGRPNCRSPSKPLLQTRALERNLKKS
jgi:hypothetical protein